MHKLRDYLRFAAYWTLPPGIECFLRGAVESIKSHRKSEKKTALSTNSNVSLKGRHKGARCFILATGPSIQEQDLSILEGELCIAVSHFFLHKDIQKISPRYHVLAPYHPPFSFADLYKVFSGFDETYKEDVTYVFGHIPYEFSVYNFLQKYKKFKKDNVYFIDYSESKALDEENHLLPSMWDLAKSPFQIRTVIYTAIQLAAYLGCNEIYLLGCDHDYLLDTNRVTNHHFYAEEKGVSDAEHLSAFTTERWFEEYYFRWKQYRLMCEYLNGSGCDIYNSTHGGMLDVFPRRRLSDVVSSKM